MKSANATRQMKFHKYSTEELVSSKDPKKISSNRPDIFLVLDNIRSMYNVGAIFRTADASGIKKIYLCGITASPPRKEIEKTALKTIDSVPWEYIKNTTEIIKKLRQDKVRIIALEQCKESKDYLDIKYKKPLAIVIGHEVDGISQEVLDLCDETVEIPMRGIANSLNVATAAGIILYKATE